MRRIIDEYKVGETISNCDADELARRIDSLVKNPDLLFTYFENCKIAAKELHWDHEKLKLMKLLETLY